MKRVVVLMSGGVDSSVAAALLKEQGYDVIGVYIIGWLGNEKFPCPWQKEEADAKSVADQLGIEFHSINLAKEYEEEVVNEFVKGYQSGITPNPDILCNREVKFKHAWRKLRQFEPDYIATGHYAKIANQGTPEAQIVRPVDNDKDQTYFLWGIDRSILPRLMFPLGDLRKAQVREIATKYNLSTAKKKDSQGICFIGKLKVRDFLREYMKPKHGEVHYTDGKIIAKHEGEQFYTIGQRLGAGSVDWVGDAPSLYVVAKDHQRNLIIVGHDESCYGDTFVATNPNWLVEPKQKQFECSMKIRYRQIDERGKVEIEGENINVKFDRQVRAITVGQSVVFYDGDVLLGGALISHVPIQEKIINDLQRQS